MESILHFDEQLFQLINGTWHNSFFDSILPIWRNKLIWAPLYVFLISFIGLNFNKNAWYFFLTLALTLAVSDTLSSKVIKKTIERPRPCNYYDSEVDINLLVNCSPSYSFTSSHATNHFALSTFLVLTLGLVFKWIRIPLLLWAASIAYAQVYVGAHFPLDVVFGSILGLMLGWIGAKLFNTYWDLE